MHDINLIRYLPDNLREVEELKEIARVETGTVSQLWQNVRSALDDQYLDTATEAGIARREKMLGVRPLGGDTLEERRMRLASISASNLPYTRRRLSEMLDGICGAGRYELTYNTGGHSLTVRVALQAKRQVTIVSDTLERVLPCNMTYTVVPAYNAWGLLKTEVWNNIRALTWSHIKEEEL